MTHVLLAAVMITLLADDDVSGELRDLKCENDVTSSCSTKRVLVHSLR